MRKNNGIYDYLICENIPYNDYLVYLHPIIWAMNAWRMACRRMAWRVVFHAVCHAVHEAGAVA